MALDKKPFRNYTVGEKDHFSTGKVFTVRLNAEEYTNLRAMQKILRISNDSTMLKKMAIIGQNVLLSTFGSDILRWLSDPERRKDESKLEAQIPSLSGNVIQK